MGDNDNKYILSESDEYIFAGRIINIWEIFKGGLWQVSSGLWKLNIKVQVIIE